MNTKTDISAAYVGSTGVDKLCLGNEVVWENFVPYERQYLTIQALEQGDFTIRRPDISYSVNKGPWVTITGATTISLDQDDTVRFKGIKTGTLGPGYQAFSANTLSFITYGNVESLEYGDNFVGQTTMLGNFMRCFHSCPNLADVSNLILPATALTPNSYYAMFYDCSGITASPVLPAPSVPYQGYRQMFYGCTSLTAITCYATEIHEDGTWRWDRYVAPSGTFYRDENMYDWNINTGDPYDGIPENWDIVPPLTPPATIPVLKIAGQSITGTRTTEGDYGWYELGQYSGTSFTIEVLGVPVTADTWDYSENYIDACGESSELTYETGTTRSTFEVYSGYIGDVFYYPDNNSVGYSSTDDNTSDDPETICNCQGGCWDGETCQECAPEDPCDDWENMGYASYEDCRCQEYGEGCEEPGDPCEGYESQEECDCAQQGGSWDSENQVCHMPGDCNDWEYWGYSSWEECTCQNYGDNCSEEESGE